MKLSHTDSTHQNCPTDTPRLWFANGVGLNLIDNLPSVCCLSIPYCCEVTHHGQILKVGKDVDDHEDDELVFEYDDDDDDVCVCVCVCVCMLS